MQSNKTTARKTVKVTHQGDTKRLKLPADYQELVQSTRSVFVNLQLPESFRFYYLDEDDDVISVTCQQDYLEALAITDMLVLRLTVATNASDARKLLLAQLADHMSVSDSCSQLSFSRRASTSDLMLATTQLEQLTDRAGQDSQSRPDTFRNQVPDKLVAFMPKTT